MNGSSPSGSGVSPSDSSAPGLLLSEYTDCVEMKTYRPTFLVRYYATLRTQYGYIVGMSMTTPLAITGMTCGYNTPLGTSCSA